MSSNGRACGRRGHWKAVCPYRTESSRPTGSSTASTAPTTTVVTEDDVILASQSLPMEFMQLPEVKESAIDEDPSAKQQGRMDEVFFVMGLGNHSHKVSEGSHNDSCETNSYGGNLRPIVIVPVNVYWQESPGVSRHTSCPQVRKQKWNRGTAATCQEPLSAPAQKSHARQTHMTCLHPCCLQHTAHLVCWIWEPPRR